MSDIIEVEVDDLKLDDHNANAGTERGTAMLRDSLEKSGAGRSILVDKNKRVIAGNKTLQAAIDAGIVKVVLVPSDGKTLVAVQRTDLDLDDEKGRLLAYADNRVGEVNLFWDPDVIKDDLLNLELDLSPLWLDGEMQRLLTGPYSPNLDPELALKEIGAADMEAAQGKLDGQFSGQRKTVDVMCPHCGGEFSIDA